MNLLGYAAVAFFLALAWRSRFLRELPVYRYAALATIGFGSWLAFIGALVFRHEQQNILGASPISATGVVVSLTGLVMGVATVIAGELLFCRVGWSRHVATSLLLFTAILFVTQSPAPQQVGEFQGIITKVGASPLWLIPLMIVVLLHNQRVKEELTARPRSDRSEHPTA